MGKLKCKAKSELLLLSPIAVPLNLKIGTLIIVGGAAAAATGAGVFLIQLSNSSSYHLDLSTAGIIYLNLEASPAPAAMLSQC